MSSNPPTEAALKLLKVAELREMLQKNQIPIPAKSNKADLIQLCLAIGSNTGKKPADEAADDLLAPPEDFDWDADEPTPAPNAAPKTKPASKPAPAPATPATNAPASTETPADKETAVKSDVEALEPNDPEYESRKRRAARFGVPLLPPKKTPSAVAANKPPADVASSSASPPKAKGAGWQKQEVVIDEAELAARKKRAERFGTSLLTPVGDAPSAKSTKKRVAAEEEIDEEEKERRRKRAERFGISAPAA